jgi:virulence-associated protein VagC
MKKKELNMLIESIKTIMEDINVPINVGDTVLGGKFKNKKIKVKDIDKNEKGDITINNKPLLRVRIPKEVTEGSVKKSDRIDIYRDNNYVVIRPLTETASCKYGTFTKWCISAPSSGAWDSNPNAIVIMIIQRNYNISPDKQKIIDTFLSFNNIKEDDEMTPEIESDMEEFMESHDFHDFEDLSKIAIVFSEDGNFSEIWDANNINLDDNYQFGWTHLPISKNVINAIENYIIEVKSNNHQLAEVNETKFKNVDVVFNDFKNSHFNTLKEFTLNDIVNKWQEIENIKNDNIDTIKYFLNKIKNKEKIDCLVFDKKGLADGFHRLIAMKISNIKQACFIQEDNFLG